MSHPNPYDKWVYEPNHEYVSHLDPIFSQGNAPRLAGMLLSLANPSALPPHPTPCYLDIPAIIVVAPNDGEFTSYEVSGAEQVGTDVYSILQGSARSDPRPDLTVEQFFYHADILSGQDIGRVREHLGTKLDKLDLMDGGFVERAVTALDATRAGDATSIWTDLFDTFNVNANLWNVWTGQAANETKEKFGHVRMWFHDEAGEGEFRQRALRKMSAILLEYAATMHGARMNLDNLMGELVDQVNKWNEKSTPEDSTGKWVALHNLKKVAGKVALGQAFSILDTVADAATLTGEKRLPEEQVYDKLTTYLESADNIVRDAVEQVNALIGDLDHVRDNRHGRSRDIPVWPE